MSNDPPPMPPFATALPYEPARDRDPLWPAMRVGLAVWALATIVRHAFYWTAIATPMTPAALVALGEVVVLAIVAVVALRNRDATRAALGTLGGLGYAMVGLALAGFLVDLFMNMGLRTFASPARLMWMLASRGVSVAIPVMLIVAGRAARR